MATTSWKDTDLCLVATAGDVVDGSLTELDPSEPLKIGRTGKGLRLPDPLVNLQHARIEWDTKRGGYVIIDLGSTTGTWVDEECIKGDSRPIGLRTKLRFGDTAFEVRLRARYPAVVRVMMFVGVASGILAVVALVLLAFSEPPPLAIAWSAPVRQGLELPSRELRLSPAFLRARGIDLTETRILRITDHDFNGRDEAWLRTPTREFVVTWDETGTVVPLGEFPAGCSTRSASPGGTSHDSFPVVECSGAIFLPTGEGYRLEGQDGVVVWVRQPTSPTQPTEPPPEGEPPPPAAPTELHAVPMRVVLKDSPSFAGFLAERSITDSAHYVICEDAFPGIRAQVLTSLGEVRVASYGCLDKLRLSEPIGKVVAVALTAAGHKALVDDVTTFYAGNPDGMFLDADHLSVIDAARRDPGVLRGGIKLKADASPMVMDAVAPERALPEVGRVLSVAGQRYQPAPLAWSAGVLSPGLAEHDPEGCADLRIRTGTFRCFGSCMRTTDFLVVEDVGCGDPTEVLSLTYSGGTARGTIGETEVLAVVDSVSRGVGLEVLQARISTRSTARRRGPEDGN